MLPLNLIIPDTYVLKFSLIVKRILLYRNIPFFTLSKITNEGMHSKNFEPVVSFDPMELRGLNGILLRSGKNH